jgi:hypothetical protein
MYTFFEGQCHEVFDLRFFHASFSTGPLIGILLAPLLPKFSKGICGGKNVLNVFFSYFVSLEMLVRIRIGSTTLPRRIHFFPNI